MVCSPISGALDRNSSEDLVRADARETVDELRDFFELNGFETEVALNAKVAFAILEERKMDLAIIGFKVQDIPGLEVLADVRDIDPFIPAVIINGSNSKKNKVQDSKGRGSGIHSKTYRMGSVFK